MPWGLGEKEEKSRSVFIQYLGRMLSRVKASMVPVLELHGVGGREVVGGGAADRLLLFVDKVRTLFYKYTMYLLSLASPV